MGKSNFSSIETISCFAYDAYFINEPQIKENFTKVSLVSCVDAADHVQSCVVCSKLYKNNNTLLILLLVFLAVINLLLLKRILETEK